VRAVRTLGAKSTPQCFSRRALRERRKFIAWAGAQAIAAMALGTVAIPRVQKIFGPGNAYVTAAKRLLFGHVAIDLLSGPSELLVLADDTANAKFAAADLLAQAEPRLRARTSMAPDKFWGVCSTRSKRKSRGSCPPCPGGNSSSATLIKAAGWSR